jgi:hypothetical protein
MILREFRVTAGGNRGFSVLILLRSRRTVDPDLESKLKTNVRLLPRKNPGADQDG